MELIKIRELLILAEQLKNNDDFVGKIELYFIRYGTKTISNTIDEETLKKKIPNAVIYEAEVESDVQKELLDIFIKNLKKYISTEKNIEPYNVISKEKEVLASLNVTSFDNVEKLMMKIKNKEDFISSLIKLNLNSVNSFCAQIKLDDDTKVFYFGKIDKFTKLKTGFFANISASEVKKLEVDKFFGFINYVSFFECNNELLIDSQDNFDSAFKMKEFFLQEAIPVLDIIGNLGKVSIEDIEMLKEICIKDSRTAKRFMKLGIDQESLEQFFSNLDESSFETISLDPVFSEVFSTLVYSDGEITSSDDKTEIYYSQLAKFIRDTANKGVISHKSKVSD